MLRGRAPGDLSLANASGTLVVWKSTGTNSAAAATANTACMYRSTRYCELASSRPASAEPGVAARL